MKKVVRILGLCALVALAFTSCKKDKQTEELKFTASITQPVNTSKTHIDNATNMLVWDANNTIKVFNANGVEGDFTTSENDVVEATFVGTLPETSTYTAFYPNAAVNGSAVTLSLNANQTYVANNFGNDTYPMAASSTLSSGNYHFNFHSPASVLRLQLKSDHNCTVKSITMTGAANDKLAGDIVYANFNEPSSCTLENGVNTVTLTAAEGVQLAAEQVTAFNLVVMSGSMSAGTKFEVRDMNDRIIKTLTTTRPNTLTAEHILIMPLMEVSYEYPDVTTTAATAVTYNSATINGTYTFPAGAPVNACGFYWGTDQTAVANGTATKVNATVETPMHYDLSGLSASTTYYFKAWATNETGESCGAVLSFTTPAAPVPVVTTNDATNVTSPADATSTGSATLNGAYNANGTTITEVGFYYGTSETDLTTKVTVTGSTATPFAYNLSGLQPGTYYFKAYAKTTTEYYGGVKQFTINRPTVVGAYSVSPTLQVWFAPANLQYNLNPNASQSSTTNPQWRFAEHQWDFLGENTNVTNLWYRNSYERVPGYLEIWANVGITDMNTIQEHWTANHNYLAYYAIQTWPEDLTTANSKYWMDLFCWGTSGAPGNLQPWNVQRDNEANGTGFFRGVEEPSYGYTNYAFESPRPGYTWYLGNNQDINGTNFDWGVYNNIYNPRSGQIDQAGTWRTLTGSYYNDDNPEEGEWYYVMHVRNASTVNGTPNARYCKARIQVNGNWINGLILFPDQYEHPAGVAQPTNINESEVYCSVNSYSTTDWAAMEAAYATFLPCAGTRFGWGKYELLHDPRWGVSSPTAPNVNLSRAYADNNQGYYWSSTHRRNVQAADLRFLDAVGGDQVNVNGGNNYNRDLGCAVRLARNVE